MEEHVLNFIAENLLIKRKRNGMKQTEMADKIGVSRSYYSEIENGKVKPSFEVLIKINKQIPIFLNVNDADRIL